MLTCWNSEGVSLRKLNRADGIHQQLLTASLPCPHPVEAVDWEGPRGEEEASPQCCPGLQGPRRWADWLSSQRGLLGPPSPPLPACPGLREQPLSFRIGGLSLLGESRSPVSLGRPVIHTASGVRDWEGQ